MNEKRFINIINSVYDNDGFFGVIEEVESRLKYGTVKKMYGLYRITTGGFSEDESLLHCLTNLLCKFRRHYCGYMRGGAFYFSEKRYAVVEMVRPYDYERLRYEFLVKAIEELTGKYIEELISDWTDGELSDEKEILKLGKFHAENGLSWEEKDEA